MWLLRHYWATTFVVGCLLLNLMSAPAFVAGAHTIELDAPPDMRKLIASVDAGHSSIVISYAYGRRTHTYQIDGVTTIQVDGSPAKLSDIKPGMEVSDYTERDNDYLDSVSLLSQTHAPTIADAVRAPVSGSNKTIRTVLADKNSVVIFFAQSKIQRTYHVDDSTALTVNGSPGKFADIKPGMEVKSYLERDSDDLDSLTLSGY